MAQPDAIVGGLAEAANRWILVATLFHLLFGTAVLAVCSGDRPSQRLVGFALSAAFLPVSAIAWLSLNPFNGVVFGVLALVSAAIARQLPTEPIHVSKDSRIVAGGAMLVLFAWVYPHFLDRGWITYLYGAPLGVLPCPTLAAVVGTTLVLDSLGSRPFAAVLAMIGSAYGAIGAVALGVSIDCVLLGGSAVLAFDAFRTTSHRRSGCFPVVHSVSRAR